MRTETCEVDKGPFGWLTLIISKVHGPSMQVIRQSLLGMSASVSKPNMAIFSARDVHSGYQEETPIHPQMQPG